MPITLMLGGDLMTGRGIDQVLPHPSIPTLHEPWVRSARTYVKLAEQANGMLPYREGVAWIWGDLLEEMRRADLRIVNLETAVTTASTPWPTKGIHYRMHPGNVGCLTAGGLDCCVLANNHVMDWGAEGLVQTLDALQGAGMQTAGAGRDREEAERPAVLATRGGRVLVVGVGHGSSGIPEAWRAESRTPGVACTDLSASSVRAIRHQLDAVRRPGDRVVVSVHWGENWGYDIPGSHQRFAHQLIDEAGVDLIHGHSSHHPLGIELYRGRAILYGCGDLLNDYEGIGRNEPYRPELSLLYRATLADDGTLAALEAVPLRIRHLALNRASPEEARWLADTLDRQSAPMGARAQLDGNGKIRVEPVLQPQTR